MQLQVLVQRKAAAIEVAANFYGISYDAVQYEYNRLCSEQRHLTIPQAMDELMRRLQLLSVHSN